MDRKFVLTALVYAILGMVLGIYMASSQNHGQHVTHAHIMLAGFVVSFIYALCHRLWLGSQPGSLATFQFWIHQAGAVGMVSGLFLLYGELAAPENLEPVLAVSAIALLVGVIMMLVLFVRAPRKGEPSP